MASETVGAGSDFFAGLVQEHRHIETRLQALDHAALALSKVESDAAALAVVAGTLRFFETEGARHQAHEELALFPRLRPLPAFEQILSALDFQHRMNDAEGRALAACLERFQPGSNRELRRLALRFAEMHRGHMFAEERALFPLAASVLPPQVLTELTREMRAREKRATPTEHGSP